MSLMSAFSDSLMTYITVKDIVRSKTNSDINQPHSIHGPTSAFLPAAAALIENSANCPRHKLTIRQLGMHCKWRHSLLLHSFDMPNPFIFTLDIISSWCLKRWLILEMRDVTLKKNCSFFQLSSKLKYCDLQRQMSGEFAEDPVWLQQLENVCQGYDVSRSIELIEICRWCCCAPLLFNSFSIW